MHQLAKLSLNNRTIQHMFHTAMNVHLISSAWKNFIMTVVIIIYTVRN